MIELMMFVGIGFLLACLLVVGVIPLVHARAVRLTTRRLEAMNPLSIAEIQADKDLLRAEFAMLTRRLERSVDELKAKTTSQLLEIGRKSEAIGRLKLELGEKAAQLFALGAKEIRLVEDLRSAQADLAAKTGALERTERALASREAELTEARANLLWNSASDNRRSRLSWPKTAM
jgi:chromosome segregation ATPase